MGKADAATKAYTCQPDVFADAFNMYLYGGRQVLFPEQLHELDSTELSAPFGAEGQGDLIQRYRDVLKSEVLMNDEKAVYLLLGIENQRSVHYAAPVKNLLYDALQYAAQVERRAKIHRKSGDYTGHSGGEFLSGFYREDRLYPVITLIILFSPEEWDGPRTLREMVQTDDPEILSFVPDYQIHLLAPDDLSLEDLKRFRSSLGDVLHFIKYAKDKTHMKSWLQSDGAAVNFSRKEIDVLNTCVNAKLEMRGKEKVSVCEAIQAMIEEATEKATKKATADATEHMQLLGVRNLMKNLNFTAEQAMKALGISDADEKRILTKL